MTAKSRHVKKKGGAGKVILWIFLSILIIFLLAVGVLALSLYTGPQQYDDPETLVTEPVMPVSARYAFHAAEESVDIYLDKSDLHWLATQSNAAFSIRDIEAAIEPYGLVVRRYGLFIDESARVGITLLLAFGESNFQLPATVYVTPSAEDGVITVRIDSLRISWLPLISADALLSKISLDPEILRFTFDAGSLHPRVKNATALFAVPGRLVITAPLDDSLTKEVLLGGMPARSWAMFEPLPDAVNARLDLYHNFSTPDYQSEYIAALYKRLESDPSYIVTFRKDVLSCSDKSVADAYFDDDYSAYRERFLPELKQSDINPQRNALYAEAEARQLLVQALAEALLKARVSGEMLYDSTRFVKRDGETPFTVRDLAGDLAAYEQWFDFDDTRIMLIIPGGDDSAFLTGNCLRFRDMQKTRGAKPGNMDATHSYMPAILARMLDGTATLIYMDETDGVVAARYAFVTNERYAYFMSSADVPVSPSSGIFKAQ